MENLHLFDEEGYLIRAAMLAFYKDPEKWVIGSYIKVGYFGASDSDLIYQDEVQGSLIEQIDKTVDLIYTKYLKALIYYEGIQRIEQFMFPQEAFREILLNAVVHKDYSACNPIQISVYEDKIYIWNDGEMPSELHSTEKLFEKHTGRLPEYNISASGIMVLCRACDKYLELLHKELHPVQCEQDNEQDMIRAIMAFCIEPKSSKEIVEKFSLPNRLYLKRHFLDQMLMSKQLKMTVPDKASSRNQKYYS